jgi:hypothetical protein
MLEAQLAFFYSFPPIGKLVFWVLSIVPGTIHIVPSTGVHSSSDICVQFPLQMGNLPPVCVPQVLLVPEATLPYSVGVVFPSSHGLVSPSVSAAPSASLKNLACIIADSVCALRSSTGQTKTALLVLLL